MVDSSPRSIWGDPARGDAHGLGELGLGEAALLALFGEPLAALAGHQCLAASFGLFRSADALDVGVAVPLGEAAHRSFSSSVRGHEKVALAQLS